MINEEVAALRRFQDAIREIREIYPRMEVGQLEVFLSICTKPGIRGAEILQKMQGYQKQQHLQNDQGSVGYRRRVRRWAQTRPQSDYKNTKPIG